MTSKKVLKTISILIDIAFCGYALLRLLEGTADSLHYSILIGSVLALVFLLIEQLRTNMEKSE